MAENIESILVETEEPIEEAEVEVLPVEEDEVAVEIAPEEIEASVEEAEAFESDDSLTFSNGVIEKIVALAMRGVPGVVGMKGGFLSSIQDVFGMSDIRKGVSVEVTPDSAVRVSVAVLIEYGSFAPQVFEEVKKAIVSNVTAMTGLVVAGVNLRIEDVLTPEEIAARAGNRAKETPRLEEAEEAEEIEEAIEDAVEFEEDVEVEDAAEIEEALDVEEAAEDEE